MLQEDGAEPDARMSVTEHLSEALASAESPTTKYHLREAYQKILVPTDYRE